MASDPAGSPGGTADAVDRYLCSYAHLSPSFARYVVNELTAPGLRSVGPAFGVDLIALVRHASTAYRRSLLMRCLLAANLVLLVLAVMLLLTVDPLWFGQAVGVLMTAAVCVGLVLPYGIVLTTMIVAHRSAQRVNGAGGQLRDLASPADPAVERRLAEVMESNVVVFRGGWPFDGCGLPLGSWSIDVDATKAATDPAGNPRQVEPFDAVDLHRELTRAVRAAGIADLRVHNRLFVGGTGVAAVPTLLPDPFDRPASRVDPKALRLGIAKPRPDARTYLCIEKFSWRGELVVSLFVRVGLAAGDLFVEGHAFVLLPIRAEMCALDRLARNTHEVIWYALRDTGRSAWRLLVRSPLELLHIGLLDLGRSRTLAADRRRVRRAQALDRGAATNIRDLAADRERIFLFAYADEEMTLNALRRRVLTGIERFLDQHGVDTTQFNQDRSKINNTNYNIQTALANTMAIGTNAQATAPVGPTGQPALASTSPTTPPTGPGLTLPWAGTP
ncbi:hypothetical protein E0H26_03520 [Micromonospora zingiberis]|uniref:Uncharacterized protein n=1 Tax=Micromonospora zingiberis TaxID=2053011 RepID=A0A4R0GPZ8_9ACTN|nr:hypothetical protein [Micromonospora zingiberis]TCB99640.1 hypothetical protein E0H26_03520 [Micromonospora zingiberis]